VRLRKLKLFKGFKTYFKLTRLENYVWIKLNENDRRILPFTRIDEIRKRRWSFFYAYDLRIVRDLFVYCASKTIVTVEDLYESVNEIRAALSGHRRRYQLTQKRFATEYIHAVRYLGLIRKIKKSFVADFSTFEDEKKAILKENQNRVFEPFLDKSLPFTEIEKKAMLKIVMNYERARDFLWWFMDFSKFRDANSFSEEDFTKYASPLLILGKMERGKKARDTVKREIDGQIWKISRKKPYDYTRLASYVFPLWFKDLGLIDEVIVFPEFSKENRLWHMYYPIRMSEDEFLKQNLLNVLESLSSEVGRKRIWTPYLVYRLASEFYCPVEAIKKGIEEMYRKQLGQIYLERAPLHLMKRTYKESYLKINGFYRSYLSLVR